MTFKVNFPHQESFNFFWFFSIVSKLTNMSYQMIRSTNDYIPNDFPTIEDTCELSTKNDKG